MTFRNKEISLDVVWPRLIAIADEMATTMFRTAFSLDVVEVHDCFTVAELLATEDLGLTETGQGGVFARNGEGKRNEGRTTVNGSGGLKAKGHPLGATGAGQAVEVFKQLRGEAGPRQVRDAEVGLTHNVGGSGATCAVHVFGRSQP